MLDRAQTVPSSSQDDLGQSAIRPVHEYWTMRNGSVARIFFRSGDYASGMVGAACNMWYRGRSQSGTGYDLISFQETDPNNAFGAPLNTLPTPKVPGGTIDAGKWLPCAKCGFQLFVPNQHLAYYYDCGIQHPQVMGECQIPAGNPLTLNVIDGRFSGPTNPERSAPGPLREKE